MDRRAFFGRAGGALALVFLDGVRLPAPLSHAHALHAMLDLEHPDPRPGITAERVIAADKLGTNSKKANESYEYARTYPEIFDSIACGCSCGGKNGTHRSLLVCFETMQGTGCLACQEEARLVGRMAKEGKSLAEIRAAVDKEYG